MIPTLAGAIGSIVYNIATGGTVTTATIGGVNYKLHTFTSNDTFTIQAAVKTFNLLLVGGGSNGATGGGGGGAVQPYTSQTIATGAYPVTVGGVCSASSISGTAFTAAGAAVATGGLNHTNAGGVPGGGYGGAAIETGPNGTAQAGGAGTANSITGTSIYYAGGGGGAAWNALNGHPSAGGAGGGGASGASDGSGVNGQAGQFYGAGGGGATNTGAEGAGASGIVIIRYEIA
jgi:hypothetical protein